MTSHAQQLQTTHLQTLDLVEALSALTASVGAVREALEEAFSPVVVLRQSTGEELQAVADLRGMKGRMALEVFVKSSDAATFTLEGSANGTDFRVLDTIVLAAAGEDHRGYVNAYPVIKVRTADANDNVIEIVASR